MFLFILIVSLILIVTTAVMFGFLIGLLSISLLEDYNHRYKASYAKMYAKTPKECKIFK